MASPAHWSLCSLQWPFMPGATSEAESESEYDLELFWLLIFACVLHDYVIINVGQDVGLVEALGQLAGWALAGAAIGLIYRPSVTPGP